MRRNVILVSGYLAAALLLLSFTANGETIPSGKSRRKWS